MARSTQGYKESDFPTISSKVAEFEAIVATSNSFDRGDIVLRNAMADAIAAKPVAEWAEYYKGLTPFQQGMFVMIASSVLSADSLREIMEAIFKATVEAEIKAKYTKRLQAEVAALEETQTEAVAQINLAAKVISENESLKAQVKQMQECIDRLERNGASLRSEVSTARTLRLEALDKATATERKYNELLSALRIVGAAMGGVLPVATVHTVNQTDEDEE